MAFDPQAETIGELPYYIIPALIAIVTLFSGKIKNRLFARSFKTNMVRQLWEVLLSFGMNGDLLLNKWKRKNYRSMKVYFSKTRDEQIKDPIYIDAYKIRQFILKKKEDKKRFLPLMITLDEIIKGKPMTREEIIEKYDGKQEINILGRII